MPDYQVLARKYRPQSFKDVLGQDHIVTTLKNAIRRNSIAHAYLFCGSRGTGKTTLARIFAKALNCQNPTSDLEPCNQCASCREITSGGSLDVLEIDGASHRGIDDIRQINETVGYSTASGKYKIYIIDEVHMLTKEAFNALLKTLEEPPPKVLFFFATTEPHKVLPTILSRCQRYNLSRIPLELIVQKLRKIADELSVSVDAEALKLLAQTAEGGLRDAESLFDQILAFHEGAVTRESVANILGMMPREALFKLDRAGKEGNLAIAFEIAHQVFSQGKDVAHFLDDLIEHFRTLLLIKLSGVDVPYLTLSPEEKAAYLESAKLYNQEQCLLILDFLMEARGQRLTSSAQTILESLLLKILRTHQRIPVDYLVKRLAELEQRIQQPTPPSQKKEAEKTTLLQREELNSSKSNLGNTERPAAGSKKETDREDYSAKKSEAKFENNVREELTPSKSDLGRAERVAVGAKKETEDHSAKKREANLQNSVSEDPTPSKADLGIVERPIAPRQHLTKEEQSRYDTLMQFAAVELEGKLQKKMI